METTTEPLVINGETYIPGTGRFAQYYKRDNAGPWLELRDGAMVKAKFPPRGPKWWRRLPGPLRTTLLVVLAINLAIPAVLGSLAWSGIFSVEDGMDTPTQSDPQVFAERIRDNNSTSEILGLCVTIDGMNRSEIFGTLRDVYPDLTYDEALAVTDAYEIVCGTSEFRRYKE